MKELSSAQGIGNDANYLNGNLVTNATNISITVNQDIVQFFQKLMAMAGLTANDNFDNETNGYQTITALLSLSGGLLTKVITGTIAAGDTFATTVDTEIEHAKIKSVEVLCDVSATFAAPPHYGVGSGNFANTAFQAGVSNGFIYIRAYTDGTSVNILGKPFTAIIRYEP